MTRRMLSESEGYDLLRDYGVPVPGFEHVTTPEAAGEAAARIGFPVVMKIVSPQIVHKSDAGGVVVGVGSPEQTAAAFAKIVESARDYDADAEIAGVLVEEQAAPGLELIIGGKTDLAFGKVPTFGMGGTLVELMMDVTLRILPIDEAEVRSMVREIDGYPLIAGYRGMKPRDEEGLVQTILAVVRFFEEAPGVVEFDINPLRLYETGGCAVDARVIVDDCPAEIAVAERPELPLEYFNPRSVAVIGASSDPRKMGYAVMHNLLQFPGQLYPVNNKRGDVQGLKAYRSVMEIPAPVDMAVVTVPANFVPKVVEECGRKGVPIVVIITAGFKEMGEQCRALEERSWRSRRATARGSSARTAWA